MSIKSIEIGFLENITGYCIKQAHSQLFIKADKSLADFGIKPAEFSILAMISLNPGIIHSRLVDHLYLTRSTSSELVESLVQKDLVIRKNMDRKSKGLYLSKKGLSVFELAKKRVEQDNKRATDQFTAQERKQLNQLLLRFSNPP